MTQAYNLSQLANKVNTSGQLDVATGVTGTQAVANGGTGQSTYTDGQLLIGNTTGNTLTKATITAGSGITVTNGSGAITIAASGGGSLQTQIFTAPGTWTKPSSCTQVRVTVIGGGGGGSNFINAPNIPKRGGRGGYAKAIVPVSAPVTITVGSGGANGVNGTAGGTSSFGPAVSSTGGLGGPSDTTPNSSYIPTSGGAGTVSVGTALKTGFIGIASASGGITETFVDGFADRPGPSSPTSYTTNSIYTAGASGIAGVGPAGGGGGGTGGAIIVEFVG